MKKGIVGSFVCGVAFMGAPALLWAQDVAQPTNGDEPRQLGKIVVTSTQTPYMRLSETATKTDLDLLDIPLSITMLNTAFLDDLRAESLADAYPYTLGLSQTGSNANNFTLRGLPADLQNVQVDGLPGLASRFGSPTTANIQRVEVLKGPASVLYGRMELGGLINIVTKRPTAERSTTISGTAQSYAGETSRFGDDLGGTLTLDSTGAIGAEGRWLYRAIASVEKSQSFRNGVNYENLYLFPSVSYQFSPNMLGTFGLEYVREQGDADDGLAAVNNDINRTAPINVRYQEDGDFDNDEGVVAFARLDYDISDATRLRLNWRSVFHEDERKLFENNAVLDATSTLRRRDRHQINKRVYHFVDANIAHLFETGSVAHHLLVGVNGGFERSDFERRRFGSNVTPNLSIFNPVLGVGTPVAVTAGSDRITDRWDYGVYVQDVADLTSWFSVMLGARYDRQDVDFVDQSTGFTDDQATGTWLPQGGVVIRPSDILSLYASYTESFNPNSVEQRAEDGSSFDPEVGEQVEVGAKAALLDERLNITLAGFNIEKTNIVETNQNGDLELLGALESKGVEFELQALPVANWQIRAGYAYVDSIISKSATAALIGARNAFAPEHDTFLWTRYNFPRQVLAGTVGASLGVSYESVRFTNASAATRVKLPGYTRTDIGLYYDRERYRLALNVENLLDERYFNGGSNDTRLYPGDPRLVTLSCSIKL